MKITLDTKKVQNRLQWISRDLLDKEQNDLFDLIMSLDNEIAPQISMRHEEYKLVKGYL